MTLSYQRIVVPLDGSELAARALIHAETLATLANARLVLIQVVPSSAMLVSETTMSSTGLGLPTVDPFFSAAQYDSIEDTLNDEAQAILNEAAAPLRARNLQVDTVILMGAPADAILTYATQEKADMIVMSTHGRSGLSRLVYGSVAEAILRRAPCPILLIRAASEPQ
jgi:nucleotide-binding universal stress UspA family protein